MSFCCVARNRLRKLSSEPMGDGLMIQVENLTKRYAGHTAVTDVSFNVRSEGIYTVKCTPVGCSGVMSDNYSVTGKIGMKVEDPETITSAKSRIYPNPAAETVTLDLQGFGDGTTVITITDTYGKSILNESTTEAGEHHFDVSRLSTGVYLMQAQQGEKVFVELFIKQ